MFKKRGDYSYIIPREGKMRTEGLIFADDRMISEVEEGAASQVANVATLPGIVGRALGMPDIHYGYGFPIGGVAAFDMREGIISPGGIGYDINCGVRLLRTEVIADDVDKESIKKICVRIYNAVPSGVGSSGTLKLSRNEVRKVLRKGARWAVEKGMGTGRDLEYAEENGGMEGGSPGDVSDRAVERGTAQLGTLGAGNHFIEIQKVTNIYDPEASAVFGIKEGQMVVMIHTGSRGLGFQICDDYLRVMRTAVSKYAIELTDRQLACAPFGSDEGRRYFSAMKCAANYAWANRQCITYRIREALEYITDSGEVELIYDLCHNVGKVEEHHGRKLVVHRKGATRAFGPGASGVPEKYRSTGQPVIIPGTMGTSSYLMRGTESSMTEAFGSTCHGAGRQWSRKRAAGRLNGEEVRQGLGGRGIYVISKRSRTLAEESPQAYKDVSRVVDICRGAGLSAPVAKMVPLGVIKG